MANGISIDNLTREIASSLENYSQDIVKKVNEASNNVTRNAVKQLKTSSPELSGDYRKGWRQKEDKFAGQPTTHTIHNKTNYQLTHLLEYGHVKKGGGRVAAIKHIEPVEKYVIEEFANEVEEAIKNG